MFPFGIPRTDGARRTGGASGQVRRNQLAPHEPWLRRRRPTIVLAVPVTLTAALTAGHDDDQGSGDQAGGQGDLDGGTHDVSGDPTQAAAGHDRYPL